MYITVIINYYITGYHINGKKFISKQSKIIKI